MNGKFRVKATSTDIGKAGTGTLQVIVALEITELGDYNGLVVWAFLSLTEAAAPYTIEKLRALGWQRNAIEEFAECVDASALLPSEAIAAMHEEPGQNGKTRTVVDFINKLGDGPAIAKDRPSRNELAVLGGRLRSIIAGTAPAPNTQRAPNKPSEFNDV
jgi:hypothetical protein